MSASWFAWAPVLAAILAVGAVSGALAVAAALPVIQSGLSRVSPAARFHALMVVIAAPALAALFTLKISFGASVLDALGLVSDHCALHVDHAFHLCFVHGVAPDTYWPMVLLMPLTVAGLTALLREGRSLLQARAWSRQLMAIGRYDEDLDCWLLDAEGVALTVGTLRPRVFLSRNLSERLGGDSWDAVLAHERAHHRRRDGLAKSLARLLAALHLPHVRARLLAQLDIASEQACDEAAAAVVGDPRKVASAIVAMARLQPSHLKPAMGQAFGAHPIEQRVRGLLGQRWIALPRFSAHALVVLLLGGLVASYERLHHSFEIALTYFF